MFISDIPLDINQDPRAVILDRFNSVNGLTLMLSDFLLSAPEVNTDPKYPQANTRVKISPKQTSKFYNSFYVYYNRMDFNQITDNPQVSILKGAATHLSDLVNDINIAYGIHLTSDDYHDQTLAPTDPNDPNKVIDVTLQALPESYLFIGSGVIHLNKPASLPMLGTTDRADVFILIKNPVPNLKEHEVIVRHLDASTPASYQFLRNATDITTCRISKMLKTNQGFLLYGLFEFKANLTGTLTSYTSNCILMGGDGAILKDCNGLFASEHIDQLTPIVNSSSDYLYFLDEHSVIGSNTSRVYRYKSNGAIDAAFNLNTTYPVKYARVDKLGRIYTTTATLTVNEDTDNDPNTPDVPISQVWVERYLSTGSLDTSFDRVVVRMTGTIDPWPIAWIEPQELDQNTSENGAYIGFEFLSKLDTRLQELPTINKVPIVDGSIQTSYGFLPIFKVTGTGRLDTQFKILKPEYTPEAIYTFDANQNPTVNTAYFTSVGDDVVILTYRQNPITGNLQKLPIYYSKEGALVAATGSSYYETPLFTEAKTITSLKLNSLLVLGRAKLRDSHTGEYKDPLQVLAHYNKDSSLSAIVYQPQTTPQGTPLVLDYIAVQ